MKIKETATRLILDAPKAVLVQLSDHFKYRPDRYWMALSYQLWVNTKGKRGWDGWNRPLAVREGRGSILRGRLEEVVGACEMFEIPVNRSELLPRPFEFLQADDLPDDLIRASFSLDEHQRTAIVAWLRSVMGMCQMVVGSGKTACCASASAFVKRAYNAKARVLYLCPTERLVNQVYAEMRKFLPDWDITQFGGGSNNPTGRDMVVATDAMLRTHFKKLLADKWFATFQIIANDECHRSLSPSREKVLMATPAFFRFACSDSLKYGNPANEANMKGLCGPVLHAVEAAPLIEVQRLARPHIYIVDVPAWQDRYKELQHRAEEGTDAWALVDGEWCKGIYRGPLYEINEDGEQKLDAKGSPTQITGYHRIEFGGVTKSVESRWCLLERLHDRGLIRFKERNELIRRWTQYYAVEKNWQTLVVCTRTLHVMALNKLISDTVGDEQVRVLFGEDGTKKRNDTFAWFEQTPGSVLISPLVKEGVSLPFIRGGVVADPVVDFEYMRQILGRYVRRKPTKDNTAHITMFFDRQHPRLRKNSTQLLGSLENVRGFRYYYPVSTPETIPEAECFETLV